MSNDYFTDTATATDFTRARASAVRTVSSAVEAAFDLIPSPSSLGKVVKPAVTPGGTANALTITNTNTISSYVTGQKIAFKAAFTNSGATTVNVDGLGVKNLLRPDGSNLVAADLTAGRMYEATYDGTAFQLHTNLLDLSVAGVGSYIASINASEVACAASADAAEAAQTAAEAAQSDAEVASAAAVAAAASFTAAGLLTDIKTVDVGLPKGGSLWFEDLTRAWAAEGSGSGLDADLLRGTTPGAGGLAILDDADVAAVRTTLGVTTAANPTFTGQVVVAAGSAGTPSVAPTGDSNTGIYFSAADTVNISAGGTNRLAITSSAITPGTNVQILADAGTTSLPGVAFNGDSDTGMCASGANELTLATAGTVRVQLNTSRPIFNYNVVNINTSKTPASAGATGTLGDVCWDSSYIYVCVGTNTWKRAAIATW